MKQKRIKVLKIVAALMLAGNLTVQAQNVSFNNERLTLKQAFEKIESVSKYKIAYNPSQINVTKLVVLNQKNKSVLQVMDELLKNSGYAYEVKGEQIVIVPQKANARQKKLTVNGRVVDEKGEVIIGANVVEHGTGNGVVTDLNGNFSITSSIGASIDVSYIGYSSKRVTIKSSRPLTVQLAEDAKMLDELVITAYGTQTRRNVTGSMQTIDFGSLQDIPAGQFTQKMQGQIVGVQVNQGTGVPRQGMSVKIRGAASLSTGANPLYVVDGFPIVGDINNINPNEIESMSVLKDAAATALYGSRAAFGVVLITTKGAKAGKTTVDVNAYLGVQSVPQKGRPEMMNGTEWAQFRKENYEDLGLAVPDIYQNPSQYGKGYNWYDAMLRSAVIQDYNVTIKGGTDKFTTSVVLGYYDQDGVMLNSDYKRFSARANAMYKLTPSLTARRRMEHSSVGADFLPMQI